MANCRQKQQDNQNKPQKYRESKKSFHQYMKKDQNLPDENINSNNSSRKPLPNNSNYSRQHSPYNPNYRGRSPNQRNSRKFSPIRYIRSSSRNNQNRNNYSKSNSNRPEFSFKASSHSNFRNRCFSIDRSRNSSYSRKKIIPTIGIGTIQVIEVIDIKTIDHAIILTTDQTIKDQNIITIKIDHAIIRRTEIQVITTDKKTTLNHHIGITHVIKIHNKIIEVAHLNIKGKSIKYKQLKKFNQTPLALIITKAQNCN